MPRPITIKPVKDLRHQDAHVSKTQKAFKGALQRYFLRRARKDVDQVIKGLQGKKRKKVSKAVDQELLKVLLKFGLFQTRDASLRAASTTKGLKALVDPQTLANQLKSQPMNIKRYNTVYRWAVTHANQIDKTTRKSLDAQVKRILVEAAKEDPAPTLTEITRRIRATVVAVDPQKRAYAFSSTRANAIAHQQLRQAENIGRSEAYEAAGVEPEEEIWLAHLDGRSGDRHHERMHRQPRLKSGSHKGMFKTPLGNYLKHPHDPSAPLADTAGCRCGLGVDISA